MSGSPHSAHDYEALLSRWREVADGTGLVWHDLCETGGHPVVAMENALSASGEKGGLYVSAGVHGDECAPVWGLLEWVANAPPVLAKRPVILFPCLNPVGLRENTRRDGTGIDLNRSFTDLNHPVIAAWRERVAGRQFDFSVNLHEDYDASGIYLYELTRRESVGHELLAACEHLIHREPSENIDGSVFEGGLLVRTEEIERVVEEQLGGGYPEAILLFLKHAAASFTFETPSEFDLSRRIDAHRAFLDAVSSKLSE